MAKSTLPSWAVREIVRSSGLHELICKDRGIGHPILDEKHTAADGWDIHGCDGCCMKEDRQARLKAGYNQPRKGEVMVSTPAPSTFDFSKQPKTEEEEVEWLRNALIMLDGQFGTHPRYGKKYQETALENEYHWIPLFVAVINTLETTSGVVLTSAWYRVMREYEYFPQAWNSVFKLKIDRDWGEHI